MKKLKEPLPSKRPKNDGMDTFGSMQDEELPECQWYLLGRRCDCLQCVQYARKYAINKGDD